MAELVDLTDGGGARGQRLTAQEMRINARRERDKQEIANFVKDKSVTTKSVTLADVRAAAAKQGRELARERLRRASKESDDSELSSSAGCVAAKLSS